MSKPVLGLTVGAILGFLDGASAWLSPEARPLMLTIVVGSTLKGLATGLIAGLVARWRRSMAFGIGAGLLAGVVLSSLAAIGQEGHYLEIVLPGMLVGALTGFVTQRYPQLPAPNRAAHVWLFVLLAAAFSGTVVRTHAQPAAPADTLAPLARLVGRWTGTSEGQPGKGQVERQYERVLRSRFIQVRNRSTYPPQEKNPKGETHDDIGFFSFDRTRKRVVLRQFHVEGFVNQYVLDPSSTVDRVVFVSESIENIPQGFRARETYVFTGSDQVEEIFEMAEPGKDFEVYSRSRLTRAQ
jgi:THAP4-like, heme-binding beta-barrel domain